MTRRPCCRPAASHDWQAMADANYVTCAKCGRLGSYQRGGRIGNRGRIKLWSYPEMEAYHRERIRKLVLLQLEAAKDAIIAQRNPQASICGPQPDSG